LGFAMVFVSHDLALVSQLADRITVMYAGQVMEQATTHELLIDPRHEYTRGLLGSVLSIEAGAERLHQVPGTVPSPRDFASGDRFAPRSLDPSADPDARPRGTTPPPSASPGGGWPRRPTRPHGPSCSRWGCRATGCPPPAPCPRPRRSPAMTDRSTPTIELRDVHVVHRLRSGGLLHPD